MSPDTNPKPPGGAALRVGFLVWNQFQVAHFAEIAKQFDEPDFIFTDRDVRALENFDPSWLVPYGAFCRFLTDTSLHTLDGQYDVIVSQHRPPLKTPWRKTRLIIYQYSLAKPKTAYNSRWFTADHGLVYGRFSESIIGTMCPTSRVGNARFDPFFEGRLRPSLMQAYRNRLDPKKRTLLYLPTWGDLSTFNKFQPAFRSLIGEFNIIFRPHHLTALRDAPISSRDTEGFLSASDFPSALDPNLYFIALADLVISDMSGAIFDALYCGKPVITLGGDHQEFGEHRKADDSGIEVERRDEIGPYVDNFQTLVETVHRIIDCPTEYSVANERLVKLCFERRGECGILAREAIRYAVEGDIQRPTLQLYAAPDFAKSLLSKAASVARQRSTLQHRQRQETYDLGPRHPLFSRLNRLSRKHGLFPLLARGVTRSVRYTLRSTATILNKAGWLKSSYKLHMICVRELDDRLLSTLWLAAQAEKSAEVGLAEALYKRARSRSPIARSNYLRLLLKQRCFYTSGREVEAWLSLTQKMKVRTLYQTYNATSALRFSRLTWKQGLARLFRTNYAPSTSAGTAALKRFGMLRTAEALYRNRNQETPHDLEKLVTTLGPLADVIDIAAKNEASTPQWQMCITPDGTVAPTSDVPIDSVVEIYLLLSTSRQINDAEQRAYKDSLLIFSENIVNALRTLGVNVYPRIQAGIIGATPVGRRFPAAFTWHTINCGLDNQFHLKIGSLYGHFIIDQQGYSGWSSIADEPLSRLIGQVDPSEAEGHWQALYDELVTRGKSKYAQKAAETDIPERYIFLPMQVLDDTVSQLADLDTLQLLKALSEWKNPDRLKIVVKRHPMCRSKVIDDEIKEAQRAGKIFVSDANIHYLIRKAECIVTVNSGVGAEALLHLKPVITTGRSDYAAATCRARTIDELYRILDSGMWRSASEDEIKRFLWFLTHRYMVHCNDITTITGRLKELLDNTSIHMSPTRQPISAVSPSTIGIPFTPLIKTRESIDAGSTPTHQGLSEQCDFLLRRFKACGVTCWVDSGSLLGFVRNGHLNQWEKDIDLGVWVEDLEKARAVCKEIAEIYGLKYREKSAKSIPYALLLNCQKTREPSTLPIAVHVFYRKGDKAWSIQPHSLVAARSKYPKYRYRELIGNRKGKPLEKLTFSAKYPRYALSIFIESLQLNRSIGRRLRDIEAESSLTEKLLVNIFNELFEWTIPAKYFENLAAWSEEYPHVLIPAATDEYLQARYGQWRIPIQEWFYVIDDGCIRLLPAKDLKRYQDELLSQISARNVTA